MKLTFMVALLILAIIGVAAYAMGDTGPPAETVVSACFLFPRTTMDATGVCLLPAAASNAAGQYADSGDSAQAMTRQGSGESTHFMDMGRCANTIRAVARSGTHQWRNRALVPLQIRI